MNGGQRGAALLIVLWACTLLAILLGGYATVARIQALQARYLLDQTRAHYAAETALVQTVYSLLQGSVATPRLRTDGAIQVLAHDGMDIRVSVRDDRGKIDLNQAPADLLQRWLGQAGAVGAAGVAESVIAWRGPILTVAQRQRLDAMYRAAGVDYGPRGAPFASLEELGRVPGVTPDLLQTLLPDATLWSGLSRPEPDLASAPVLAVVSNLDPSAARQAYASRIRHPLTVGSAGSYGAVESLEVSAGRGGGVRAMLSATVRLQAWAPDRPYTILRWQEGIAP